MTDAKKVKLYYIGGDGRENRPHPIMFGEKIVFTPPLGEPFPIEFTELEAHCLIQNSAFTSKGRVFYSVTRDYRVAQALKSGRTLDEVINNAGAVTLSDEQLLEELTKRKIQLPVKRNIPQKRAKQKTSEVERNA